MSMVPPAISTRQGAFADIFILLCPRVEFCSWATRCSGPFRPPLPIFANPNRSSATCATRCTNSSATHGFGRGISAVQIGAPKRLIYIEFEGAAYRLQNPVWRRQSEAKFRLWDDCFSFPNLLVYLERAESVAMEYETEAGPRTLEAAGALSELLQHEMDHLDGMLAVDRAIDGNSLCTREEWERRYRAPR